MKKTILLLCILISSIMYSQEKQTTDQLSLKFGIIGGWIGYEKSLSKKFTINSEIGYEGGILINTHNKVGYVFTTSFSTEPRYYYNFNKRIEKGKNTKNNAANYLSAELYYIPDLLTSSNRKNISVTQSIVIIPKWGLRRSLSEHLNFEFAIGIGYEWGENNISGMTAALDLKFGYSF